jgi:hypothetical protein
MFIQDALDRIKFLCHQCNSVEDVDAYQTLKQFVLAQQSTNKQSTPFIAECPGCGIELGDGSLRAIEQAL